MKFQELDIIAPILRAVEEKGYEEPTPIQQEAIPVVMAGKDIFGIARTGTGKTAAFAIPIIQQLMALREQDASALAEREAAEQEAQKEEQQRAAENAQQTTAESAEALSGEDVEGVSDNIGNSEPQVETRNQRRRRLYRERVRKRRERREKEGKLPHFIRALILTPTRELALQIDECFTDYGKYSGLRHTAIFGGVKQRPQTDALRKGVDILIATPGRLLDLMGQGEVKLVVDLFTKNRAI